MRKLWLVLVLLVLAADVDAGEIPIASGCAIASTSPTAGSSASDTDCSWSSGTWLMLQCDAAVYYRFGSTAPTSTSPKVTFPGDAYPIRAPDSSASSPLKVLAVSGTVACNVYKYDNN